MNKASEEQRRPFLDNITRSLPLVVSFKQRQRDHHISSLQRLIDDSFLAITSTHSCPGPSGPSLTTPVVYYGLEWTEELHLPVIQCHKSDRPLRSFSPQASSFGCWPSSPVYPRFWIDLSLMVQYQRLGPIGGVSARGFIKAIDDVHSHWALQCNSDLRRLFFSSFMEYSRATKNLYALGQLGLDVAPIAKINGQPVASPLDDCFLCSPTSVVLFFLMPIITLTLLSRKRGLCWCLDLVVRKPSCAQKVMVAFGS